MGVQALVSRSGAEHEGLGCPPAGLDEGWTRGPWNYFLRPTGPGPQAFGRAAASVSEHFSYLVNWKELIGWVGAGCGSSPFPMAKAAFPGHLA